MVRGSTPGEREGLQGHSGKAERNRIGHRPGPRERPAPKRPQKRD